MIKRNRIYNKRRIVENTTKNGQIHNQDEEKDSSTKSFFRV